MSLPLDLHRIAARCRNSYYAPTKFSAVQLAYSEPRCRVLVFRKLATLHTFESPTLIARVCSQTPGGLLEQVSLVTHTAGHCGE